MSGTILGTTKKLLGLAEEYTVFDQDIIVFINNAFFTLNQLGIGPDTPYHITDGLAIWESFQGENLDLEAVKTYVYIKTRLMFDPPETSYAREAFEKTAQELEWRLNAQVETFRNLPAVAQQP